METSIPTSNKTKGEAKRQISPTSDAQGTTKKEFRGFQPSHRHMVEENAQSESDANRFLQMEEGGYYNPSTFKKKEYLGNIDYGDHHLCTGTAKSRFDGGKCNTEKTQAQEWSTKLFFKHVSKRTPFAAIKAVLSKFGKVENLRVPFSPKKKKNLGYGYVKFESKKVPLFLCDHGIKTVIDGRVVSFERFDSIKFSSKKKKLGCDKLAEPVGDQVPPTKPISEKHPGSFAPQKIHFPKPTNRDYHQSKRSFDLSNCAFRIGGPNMKKILKRVNVEQPEINKLVPNH